MVSPGFPVMSENRSRYYGDLTSLFYHAHKKVKLRPILKRYELMTAYLRYYLLLLVLLTHGFYQTYEIRGRQTVIKSS